jgi:hypothetical protein
MIVVVVSAVHDEGEDIEEILEGFNSKDEAKKWIEEYDPEWNKIRGNCCYYIMETKHYREML